jgi:hypothetical protein
MKFTFMTDDVWSGKKVTYVFDEDTLPKILENFELFLKANGFEFDGYLDFSTGEFDEEFDDDYRWPKFGEEELQTEPTIQKEKCPICYIDKDIMANHQCFDSKCPKDTW